MENVYTLEDLKHWDKINASLSTPIRLAVLGDPIAHSLSPGMQNAALEHCRLPMQYARLLIRSEELAEAISLLPKHGFVGANLTIPHKQKALSLVDEVDPDAQRLGAANTLVISSHKVTAFNTDGPGFARCVEETLHKPLADLRVGILGVGGTGHALALQCAYSSCRSLWFANRTDSKAAELVSALQILFPDRRDTFHQVRWADAALVLDKVDLLVNATSIGLKEHNQTPLSFTQNPNLAVLDCVYHSSSKPTRFLQEATQAGCKIISGLDLLLHQGALAFEHWFHRQAPLAQMRATL